MGEPLSLESWQDTPVLFHPLNKALDKRRERKREWSRGGAEGEGGGDSSSLKRGLNKRRRSRSALVQFGTCLTPFPCLHFPSLLLFVLLWWCRRLYLSVLYIILYESCQPWFSIVPAQFSQTTHTLYHTNLAFSQWTDPSKPSTLH